MPAPTALRKKPEELADAINVPLPSNSMSPVSTSPGSWSNGDADEDTEFLLDAPDAVLSESNSIIPTASADPDTDMHVDEEGRPRFAPAKNTVCGCMAFVLLADC
jgi:RNA-binding protein PNO1